MNCTIHITSEEIGNPRRGYHNTRTTIQFAYTRPGSYWTTERERELVSAFTGGPSNNMWWYLKKEPDNADEHGWVVEHGFDSGD